MPLFHFHFVCITMCFPCVDVNDFGFNNMIFFCTYFPFFFSKVKHYLESMLKNTTRIWDKHLNELGLNKNDE